MEIPFFTSLYGLLQSIGAVDGAVNNFGWGFEYSSDVLHPIFRGLCLTGSSVPEEIEDHIQDFKSRKLPFCCWFDPLIDQGVTAPLLEQNGLVSPGRFEGMALPISAGHFDFDDGVKQVANSDDLSIFLDIMGRGFGFDFSSGWWAESIESKTFSHYTIEDEVIVAGCATLQMTGGVGCLINLTTLPEHRGRGLATKITSHILKTVQEAGGDLVTIQLESDAMAKGVMERAGFQHVAWLHPYLSI